MTKQMTTLSIIGNGGLSRELRAYLREFTGGQMGDDFYKIYVSDEYHNGKEDEKNNIFKLSTIDTETSAVIIAIADPAVRRSIVEQLPADTHYFTFIHPMASIYTETIGSGSIVGPNAVITTDVTVGAHCLINCNVTVGHDTKIGDYCTVNPGVNISGNCTIGEEVFIGTSAAVRENTKIINNTTIGMGAIVLNDITTPFETHVGVPAMKLMPRSTGPIGFITTALSKDSPYAAGGDHNIQATEDDEIKQWLDGLRK